MFFLPSTLNSIYHHQAINVPTAGVQAGLETGSKLTGIIAVKPVLT
jgi:hypothetical protein